MKKLSAIFLALLVGFVGIGCDSNSSDDDELSVAEQFVDMWALSGVSDDDGDQLAAFTAGFTAVDVTFASGSTFSIDIDAVDDASDQVLSGTYSVNEAASRLTLTTTVPGTGQIGLNFTYAFTGSDTVTLTADAVTSTLLNVLLGTSLSGQIEITVSRV